MSRYAMRLTIGGGVLALALALTGCGSDKKSEPRTADPNAPKIEPQTPGGPGAGKGKVAVGPKPGSE